MKRTKKELARETNHTFVAARAHAGCKLCGGRYDAVIHSSPAPASAPEQATARRNRRKALHDILAGNPATPPELCFNPACPENLSVPERHQLKIARDTLRMADAMVGVAGGPSKAEAREIILRLTGKRAKE